MITVSSYNFEGIRFYTQQLTKFLQNYTWVLDAYVSDFYFKNHWDRLPESWCSTLSDWNTEELSFLLDRQPVHLQTVAPLSLLSFKACCDAFSLDRRCEVDVSNRLHRLFNKGCSSPLERIEGSCNKDSEDLPVKFSPLDDDGKLHAFFKKHVKPKKQHEIKNLAQVIYYLCEHIGCDQVIDVGSGLGHLARLLSFGYNLHVTSVEAAGTHAPKASKYDREINREIRKKMQTAAGQLSEDNEVSLPCHVTSMIYPNMSADEFLAIIRSQQEGHIETMVTNQQYTEIGIDNCIAGSQTCSMNEGKISADCVTLNSFSEKDSLDKSKNLKPVHCQYDCQCTAQKLNKTDEEIIQHNKKDNEMIRNDNDSSEKCLLEKQSDCNNLDKNSEMGIAGFKEFKSCSVGTNYINTERQDLKLMKFAKQDVGIKEHYSQYSQPVDPSNWRFLLTGLHACGDLTPTFLRFFVNCDAAVGLASVGCCYMKISDESTSDMTAGYPMSQYVASLPHHNLSYACRELACHFADTYSQRLKECPPLLKIHSYRAALEWIANQLCPGFKRTAVQIPTRKIDNLQFERYVQLGLEKLNIPHERLTDNLLAEAYKMTERWKDVVAFYTIRLALAPVVETLLLLDRMIFLYEKGYVSAGLPVFDPELSPRNFVLLSWKDQSM